MITTDRIIGRQEDVSGAFKYINANKAPFYLNLLALGNVEEAKSTTVSWVDYTCEGTQTVLSEELTDGTATSLKVADTTVFKPKCFARIEDEVILVASIQTDEGKVTGTLTIERGQLSTTAAAHAVATPIYFINENK